MPRQRSAPSARASERGQHRIEIVRPAGGEQAMQRAPFRLADRRALQQQRIGIGVARQQRELQAPARGKRAEFVDAIGPIARPAEQPHDNKIGMAHRLFEPKIDREIIGKAQKIGQPDIPAPGPVDGAGHGRKLTVGRRHEDDLSRRLAEIDGLAFLLMLPSLSRQQMHQGVSVAIGFLHMALSKNRCPLFGAMRWASRSC